MILWQKTQWFLPECHRPEPLLELLDTKPYETHVILTGRNAHPQVIERAHLVTEMTEVKHPYKQGILAQKGIDF